MLGVIELKADAFRARMADAFKPPSPATDSLVCSHADFTLMKALSPALFLVLLMPGIVRASTDWETPGTLSQVVESYARSQTTDLPGKVRIGIGAIDPRLRLPRCTQPMPFQPPSNRLWGNSTVGIRCHAPSPWTIYVPVTINVMAGIVATARPLSQGHLLTVTDLVVRDGDLTQLPAGVLTDTRQAAGQLLAVAVPSGTPLRGDMLRAPLVVIKGQKVRVLVQGRGFSVNAEGIALSSATVGQPVSVRTQSGRIVSGTAQGEGVVELPF